MHMREHAKKAFTLALNPSIDVFQTIIKLNKSSSSSFKTKKISLASFLVIAVLQNIKNQCLKGSHIIVQIKFGNLPGIRKEGNLKQKDFMTLLSCATC